MKSKSPSIGALCLVCFAFSALPAGAASRLLVKWKDGPTSYAATTGNAQVGGIVKRSYDSVGWQLVELPSSMGINEGLSAYRALDAVAAVEPDGPAEVSAKIPRSSSSLRATDVDLLSGSQAVAASTVPNDPRYGAQWNLRKISAPNAWSITTGTTNSVVAVLDTGVDYTHPDLRDNMWRNPGETGWDSDGKDKATNGVDDDDNGYIDDLFGISAASGTGDPMDITTGPPEFVPHGTICAGVIGAVGNNGIGSSGVAWRVGIMAVNVGLSEVSANGAENVKTLFSSWVAAYDYVITMKRRGVNIVAMNVSNTSAHYSAAVRDAILVALSAQIIPVFSANNAGVDNDLLPLYPIGYNLPGGIWVAASDQNDALNTDSNFGRGSVHLSAPGINITTTIKGDSYQSDVSGTSVAAPHVAAAIALLAAHAPNSSAAERKAAILHSVDKIAGLRDKLVTGGRLNVSRALEQITNPSPLPIVLSATPATSRAFPEDSIRIEFNREMDTANVESSFQLTPNVAGRFEWTESNRIVKFIPESPLPVTNYTAALSAAATDSTGSHLDGNYNRVSEVSPADDYRWAFRFSLLNDNFLRAQRIGEISGSVAGTTRNATPEVEEPGIAAFQTVFLLYSSVWYRWTAPANSWMSFNLSNASFDTLLGIYSGTNLTASIELAGNDNYGTTSASRVSFQALSGHEYFVLVAGKNAYDRGATGPFTLSWYPTPPPGLTGTQFTPASAAPGAKITLTGTNFTGATEVLFNGASASFTNGPTNNHDLRITATVPLDATSGPITILTPHGNVTSTSLFTVLERPRLTIRIMGDPNLVELTWPGTNGFGLQHADGPTSTSAWTTASVIYTQLANGTRVATVTNLVPNRFYRLYRP